MCAENATRGSGTTCRKNISCCGCVNIKAKQDTQQERSTQHLVYKDERQKNYTKKNRNKMVKLSIITF